MKRRRFLVAGLGVLGRAVARNLSEEGAEVIVIDNNPRHIEQMKDIVAVATCGDSTEKKALQQLGVPESIDAAVVCIGEGFEGAVLTTAHLLDLGVEHVAGRVNNDIGKKIMERLGAHEIFSVEGNMGKFVAHRLMQPSIAQEMEIGDGYRIVQWSPSEKIVGKTLVDLALPKNYKIQVVAVREASENKLHLPDAQKSVEKNSILFLLGHEKDLKNFFSHCP